MSAYFKYDCNRCHTSSVAMTILEASRHPNENYNWYAFTKCGVCDEPSLLLLTTNSGSHPPQDTTETFSAHDVEEILPKKLETRMVNDLPENVERSYIEAEKAFKAGLFSAAGSCYRKAMERATKKLDPEIDGMLNKRIRELEKKRVIPSSMIDLLDHVRLFGNSSMHEDDSDPSYDDCANAREFAFLFLTYAFTMPKMVEKAKAKLED